MSPPFGRVESIVLPWLVLWATMNSYISIYSPWLQVVWQLYRALSHGRNGLLEKITSDKKRIWRKYGCFKTAVPETANQPEGKNLSNDVSERFFFCFFGSYPSRCTRRKWQPGDWIKGIGTPSCNTFSLLGLHQLLIFPAVKPPLKGSW